MDIEIKPIALQPHPFEFGLYYDVKKLKCHCDPVSRREKQTFFRAALDNSFAVFVISDGKMQIDSY